MFGLNYECKSVNENNSNIVTHKCRFCGKVTTYDDSKQYLHEEQVKKNQCHTLRINRTGYGSGFENREIAMPICDECAMKLDKVAIYYYDN